MDVDEREDTNDSSVGVPGDGLEPRATMVPPTSLSTYVSQRHMGTISKREHSFRVLN